MIHYCLKQYRLILLFSFFFLGGMALANDTRDIHSLLKCCPCKSPSIASCSCPKAEEMKAYIQGLKDAQLPQEGILAKLVKKYSFNIFIDDEIKNSLKNKLIAEASEDRPQIFISPKVFNLGKLSKKKGRIEFIAEIENRGNKPLIINSLKTSCGCTTVKLKTLRGVSPEFSAEKQTNWQGYLDPQEKGKLVIAIDLTHPHVKIGNLFRSVEIESNDPVNSFLRIKIEAQIVE